MFTIRLFLSLILSSMLMASPSPLGESAKYQLDKDPKRTSSFIKSGWFNADVTHFLAEKIPPAYQIVIQYAFKIYLVGTQQGTEKTLIDKNYFDPEFLENLRLAGHYEGAQFKVDHLGFADAKTLDGHVYPHCDRLRFYDVVSVHPLTHLIASMLASPDGEIQDLVIHAHVFFGIPVLGGAKIDVSGLYEGLRFKVGVDFVSP